MIEKGSVMKEFSEDRCECSARIASLQDVAALLIDSLMDAASATNSELDLSYTRGERSVADGSIAVSTLLNSNSGSICLIEDRDGRMWLARWTLDHEAARVRRVELGDDLDELIEFCMDLP